MKQRIVYISALAVALVAGSIFTLNSCRKNSQNVSFETSKIQKGSVSNTVTATGTIQAIKTVAVGTQVSGVIDAIYADFNSQVKKGQLLAEIDRTPLIANLENSQASLDNAKAELLYQEGNHKRIKALYDKNLVAQTDYDLALYNYSKAQANLKIAKSGYDKSKINLDYASIYSPIDGVVLNRAVDEGQTVAASFNTPTLFSIANDLTQMQVEANIDEADIGQINNGDKVYFTVDAFPDMKFNGEVTQIRLQSVTTSNVVTYTVIVKAPNPEKKLMPGMTASITIVVEEALNALILPGKALRFIPDTALLTTYMNGLPPEQRQTINVPNKALKPADESAAKDLNASQFAEIWVKNGNQIHQIKIETGITDGINTEIKSGLKEGDNVIVAMTSGTSSSSTDTSEGASSSPFMPKPPSRK